MSTQDEFRTRLQQKLASGQWIAAMHRKYSGCGELIPLYSEYSEGESSYLVDTLDHQCRQEEQDALRQLLIDFIKCYANVGQKDEGEMHVELFRIWLEATTLLGITLDKREG